MTNHVYVLFVMIVMLLRMVCTAAEGHLTWIQSGFKDFRAGTFEDVL